MEGKRMLKGIYFIIVFLVSSQHTVFATIRQHTDSFYVNDFANVLTSETTSHIYEKNLILNEVSGAQIVVATVDFTDGMDIEDYAKDMFNHWGIGDAVQNNGILLLLVIGQEDYFVATGDGINDIVTAGELDRIIKTYLEPYFNLGNYDEGVIKTFNEIYNIMERSYNITGFNNMHYTPLSTTNTQPINTLSTSNSFFAYLFLLIIFIMLVPAISGGRRRRRGLRRRSRLFWWIMPSPLSRNRRQRNNPRIPPQINNKYKGNTPFGGGGKSTGGRRRGGSHLGGGGRSSGGGVGRRR